jgi:hypothetical protein
MSLAVATREIPELYSLADDPSNDGQVFNWQEPAAVCNTHRLQNEDSTPRAHGVIFSHIGNLWSTSVVPARTGQDILRIVSLLRT